MSRPSVSANDRPAIGMNRRSPSFSLKSNRSSSSILSAATAQRAKSFCEYIQLFCSLTNGKLDFQEVESIILHPIMINTDLLQQMCPLVTTFANVLRMAQTEPQDWFDFIAHRKGGKQNADAMRIDRNEFVEEFTKLCGEIGFPLLSEEDMLKLFNFIKGDRQEEGFTLFNLAVAFAKYRLSPTKVRAVNIVASQLQDIGVFLAESHLSLKILGEFSVSSLKTGLITINELSVMFTNLLIRKDASDESESILSAHSNDSTSVSITASKYSTAPLVAASTIEEEDAVNVPAKMVDTSSVPVKPTTNPNRKPTGNSNSDSHNNKSNVCEEHVAPSEAANNTVATRHPPANSHPKKRKSFLENLTEAVLSAIQFTAGGNSSKHHRANANDDNNNADTNTADHAPNCQPSQPKRGSFFNLKRINTVAPASSQEEPHCLDHPINQNTTNKGLLNKQQLPQRSLSKSTSTTMNSTSIASHASTVSSSSSPHSMHSISLSSERVHHNTNNSIVATGENVNDATVGPIQTQEVADQTLSNDETAANNTASSLSQSPEMASQLRSQLAIFLQADEQEQLKRISSGIITIKHGKDPSKAIRGGLFSTNVGGTSPASKSVQHPHESTNTDDQEDEDGNSKGKRKNRKMKDSEEEDDHRHFHPRYYAGYGISSSRDDEEDDHDEDDDSYARAPRRRRYSSLMSNTEDWGEDLLTDSEEKLKLLWVVKQHQHHHQQRQQFSPVRENSRFSRQNTLKKQNSNGNLSKQHPFQEIVRSFDRRMDSAQRLVAQLTR